MCRYLLDAIADARLRGPNGDAVPLLSQLFVQRRVAELLGEVLGAAGAGPVFAFQVEDLPVRQRKLLTAVLPLRLRVDLDMSRLGVEPVPHPPPRDFIFVLLDTERRR